MIKKSNESFGGELKDVDNQDFPPETHGNRPWLRRWASVFSVGGSGNRETQRGMKSRHLMMIGRRQAFNSHY